MKSFDEAQAYLSRHFSSAKTYSLERMKTLLGALGSPHLAIPTIHVGGTAGKGSTSYLIASILEHAGYNIGLYTSPHLVSITERIMINQKPISETAFVDVLKTIKPAIAPVTTYFEILTAMAFVYFKREHVDVAVIEVGIGGKLDATNVVRPLVSVITNVGLDHTEILGETTSDIARDKREIIKYGKPIVSAVTQKTVQKLIIEKSTPVGAPLFLMGRDFDIKNIRTTSLVVFDYISSNHSISNIHLSLMGRHQATNAALAITAVFQSGLKTSHEAIRNALSRASIPGRMETRNGMIIDGAHNPLKIGALSTALSDHFPGIAFETLFAVKGDKNCARMVRLLAPHVSHWHLTTLEAQTDWGRGMMLSLEKLTAIVKEADPKKSVDSVYNIGEFLNNPPSSLLITGSLYLVGAVETLFAGSRM